jgi:16S rRNA (adenine1518-N6/adenine1519-N6)-dimethyltransferase
MKLKKEFGQNFLTNREFAQNIVEIADISNTDTVVEVGPGAGIVTEYLYARNCKTIAVEIDFRLVELLRNRFKGVKNVVLVQKDILEFQPEEYGLSNHSYKLVGSLPYNISKKIIRKFLEERYQPKSITVIVQKEVAEDYTKAIPKASFLSNYVQLFGNVIMHDIISKEEFNPVPKVDGEILQIKNIIQPTLVIQNYIHFLKTAFTNPRKKLINNLKGIYHWEKEELEKLFGKIGIAFNVRASNISQSQWEKLFTVFTRT